MQIKYSDNFNAIIARCGELWNAPADAAALDAIMALVLQERNCHATYILEKLLTPGETQRLGRMLSNITPGASAGAGENLRATPAQSMALSCGDTPGEEQPLVTTGNFLFYVAGEEGTATARFLTEHHITQTEIADYLAALPADEDFYEAMRALQRHVFGTQPDEAAKSKRNRKNGESGENISGQDDLSAGAENSAGERESGDPSAMPIRILRIQEAPERQQAQHEKFGADLTRMAAEGRIDPVVGREAEIERLIQILGRRKKNNPVLIGEAGVGKTAIAEGLALRIASGQVPHTLRGKRLFSLDVGSLVAGTKYRGEFEERIKNMMEEMAASGEVILFIDEIHTIVGAGSSQGSLDAANILKPALARGTLQCIGATTLDEYRENIEKDAALERRFQKVIVQPSTPAQTLEILSNIRPRYEEHHMVRYTDEALAACVELTGRYITDRNFPDKAIDVLDEAGSRACLGRMQEPEDIQEIEAAVQQAALLRREALTALNIPAATNARMREAALRERMAEMRSDWMVAMAADPVRITVEDIERVVTSITGVPVEKVSQGEKERLRDMDALLGARVVGQEKAVDKVCRSIRRSRAGLKDPGKPIGVFMFVGPTGVGKTLLAKELSALLFDRPDAVVRLDMSEYSEKHNVSRLVGSPPGYVGYGEGGQLTESIRRQPYAVVLLDEIEKAHPEVLNTMLQLFDEGWLTDGQGRKVDFRNTIIIMTSNIGSATIARRGPAVGYRTSTAPEAALQGLHSHYRGALESAFVPEFINRIDDIVVFEPLGPEQIGCIARIELDTLRGRLETLGYRLEVTGGAMERLVAMGYDARYGVRSLKRAILEQIEEPVAGMIVAGQAAEGDTLTVDSADGETIAVRAVALEAVAAG